MRRGESWRAVSAGRGEASLLQNSQRPRRAQVPPWALCNEFEASLVSALSWQTLGRPKIGFVQGWGLFEGCAQLEERRKRKGVLPGSDPCPHTGWSWLSASAHRQKPRRGHT